MKFPRAILSLMLAVVVAQTVCAANLIPVPDFARHEIPQTQNPAPRTELLQYLDLAMLVVGLGLASYFAIRRRSRRGLLLLSIVSLVWLGFWRKGCICPIGAIQNVSQAVFDPGFTIPATVLAWFVLPLVFTLFFGRTFCASVCPLGAVQELVAVRPVKVPRWLDHAVGMLAYVYLGLAVAFAASGAAYVICRYDPFVGLFRLSASLEMLVVSAGFLVLGIFVARPYCRYLCPYGAILGLLSRLSRWRVKIPPESCIQCRLCEDACPYGAIREPTVTPPIAERQRGRRRLVAMIALLPVLVAGGAWLGSQLESPMSRAHPTVQLAELVWLQEHGQAVTETDAVNATDAFRNSGRKAESLYGEAQQVRSRMGVAGVLFGAWVGLVLGVKLIHLSIRRRRTDYEPDPSRCVSCGRCFWYCPNEQARHGQIQTVPLSSKDV